MERYSKRGRINVLEGNMANLSKMKLVRDGKPTLASVLMFGEHNYSINLVRFKSQTEMIDEIQLKLPLMTAVEEAMVFIKKHINLSYRFDGTLERNEHWQYPLLALREILLNAVIHRDYKLSSDIIVKIFDDRIIFLSPGRLYGNQSVQELEHDDYVSVIRNKLLAESFYLLGEIEKYGTGLLRVRKQLHGEYSDVRLILREQANVFKVELRLPITPPITPSKRLQGKILDDPYLSGLEKNVLLCISENPFISYSQIALSLDISRDTVKEYANKLKAKRKIRRHGPSRGGYWELI